MFTTRDQENLVHGHNLAAVAKPLNQGVSALAPKTPGNKTSQTQANGKIAQRSFRKNDENGTTQPWRGNGAKQAFVTPLVTRDRAPLGARTTNVKATAFMTPAPPALHTNKRTIRPSTSTRKPKLKIHQQPDNLVESAASANALQEDSEHVPDVEYCPPKVTDLPDMSDDEFDNTFPQFANLDLTKEFNETHFNPIGKDGLSRCERQDREDMAALDKYAEKVLYSADDSNPFAEDKRTSIQTETMRSMPKTNKAIRGAPSMTHSRNASSALSAYHNAPISTAVLAKRPSATASAARARTFTPATAASRTTIGYTQGRKVSSTLKPTAPVGSGSSEHKVSLTTINHTKMDEVDLIKQLTADLASDDDEADTKFDIMDWGHKAVSFFGSDEVFHLDVPKLED